MADLQLSRRQLMLGAAAAGATVVAYATVGHVGRYPAVPEGIEALSPKDVAVFRTVGDWILPPGSAFPGSGGDDETLLRADRFVSQMPPDKALWVHGLLALLEHGTAMDRFGSARLTSLSPDKLQESMRSWADSDVLVTQQLWHAFRSLIAFSYFDRPDVVAVMGLSSACA